MQCVVGALRAESVDACQQSSLCPAVLVLEEPLAGFELGIVSKIGGVIFPQCYSCLEEWLFPGALAYVHMHMQVSGGDMPYAVFSSCVAERLEYCYESYGL